MSYQNISQGLGQVTITSRPRRLRSVGRVRQFALLRQVGLVALKLLPVVLVVNLAFAYLIGKVDQRIVTQTQLLKEQKELQSVLEKRHQVAFSKENIEALAAERLGMERVQPGHYGVYSKKRQAFVFN